MMTTLDDPTNAYLMIRATVEAQIPSPGVLTVSSALASDGKTSVVAGIARSLAAAGYSTLALDATVGIDRRSGSTIETATAAMAEQTRTLSSGCDFLALAHVQTAAATAVADLFAAARARYDYTIVDASVVGNGGLPFARSADGVVLALREGRAIADADRDAVELFARLNVRFLGVVATRDNGTAGDGPRSLRELLHPHATQRTTQLVPVDEPARGIAYRWQNALAAFWARWFVRSNV